ncbi:MAG: hypothetical protein PHI18_00205 [bacterium]|nr:hypothetical protein [bacterium]
MSELRTKRRMTDREAQTRVDALVARIRHAATPLASEPGDSAKRIAQGEKDFWFYARTYFPHYFTNDSADVHYTLVDLLQEPGVSVDRLPRGWAKTTIGQIFTSWCLVYGKRMFAVLIGKTQETAEESALAIILEFEENERLRQDFGDQQTAFWSFERGFRLKRSGAHLIAIGREGVIRGRKKGPQRPDFILADDIEDEELVRNPKRVKQLLRWWLQSVIPALAAGGTAAWLCTNLGQKSATTLLLDPEWTYDDAEEPPLCRRFRFKAINADGESSWPGLWPLERLQAKKAEIGSTAFNTEFMDVAEPVGAMFRSEWMRYYNASDLPAGCVTAIIIDPSAREKSTSNCKAVLTLSKDVREGNYYCRAAFVRIATIRDMCLEALRQWVEFRPNVILIETIGFQLLVRDELLRLAKSRGLAILVKCIDRQITKKEIRIQGIQPLAENGRLFFLRHHTDQDTLVEQFCYFPSSSVDDDGPDAFEMGVGYLKPFESSGLGRKYKQVRARRDLAKAL